ncbi:MAG: tRNA uridine-5-carboxymethylaminomethyl(34) synthesis GTPase MnmE [Oscillospiraceae bacterium]|nr:tRNA uridine-5-carboxymethylaminomethyl(34) synthesis GTPase MnmE [Oscillospiraceae bacterium]
METTIAAISTALLSAGIGVVRISGTDAFTVADKVFRANSGKPVSKMRGYTSALGRVFDGQNNAIDEAVCQIFCAPKSYTGEDVAEISCHGSVWILQKTWRLCLENGAHPASPGEFTKRAFLNGKLSLTQAEAVMHLISAGGESAAKAALLARDGVISGRIYKITGKLVEQSAFLAAWADFPEEDLEALDAGLLMNTLVSACEEIEEMLRSYDAGKILRDGILTVIAGRPNVGKSTLMNLLAGEDRSIVTDVPGTTRDIVEDTVRLGDFTLRLSDTAGIRKTDDTVESIGVLKAKLAIDAAELVLAVFDSSDELSDDDNDLLLALSGRPCIAVINKIDLPLKLQADLIRAKIPHVVTISAKSGEGRDELLKATEKLLGFTSFDPAAGIVMSERQRLCLIKAGESLEDAKTALSAGMTDAVGACVDFAIDILLELTGERASDRVIDEVFANFCVGK